MNILLDNGSNSSIMTTTCAKELGLELDKSDRSLCIKTLTGSTEQSSITTEISTNGTALGLYVVNTEMCLDKPNFNLEKVWPSLSRSLNREVTANIIDCQIDIVIGMVQLYEKVTDNKTIAHPSKR